MFEDILKQIMEEKNNESHKQNTVYIGELPLELKDQFKRVNRAKERYRQDVEIKKMQYRLEVERKLEEEFEGVNEDIRKQHEDVWNQVYNCLMIDGNQHYFQENGKIYMVKEERNPFDFTKPNHH